MSGKGYIDYNHTDLAIRKMKERFRNGHALDFQELVSRFTLDSATEFLFGNCVHSLMMDLPYAYNDPPSPEIAQTAAGATAKFSQAFTGVQEALAVRLRIGWSWIFSEVFKDTTRKHMEVVSAYIQPIVEEALRRKRSAIEEEKTTDDEETLLDHLVKQTEGARAARVYAIEPRLISSHVDPAILHDETLNIMIAGRDTVSPAALNVDDRLVADVYCRRRRP